MNLQARRLTEFVGAEIVGIDLARPIDEETKSRVYRYFADYAVLCSATSISTRRALPPPRSCSVTSSPSSSTITVIGIFLGL